jgi:hypothetical protein
MGFNEINHKIDMKVKKDCQVIISPLVQSMSGYRQAIFSAGEDISDWVADVKKVHITSRFSNDKQILW